MERTITVRGISDATLDVLRDRADENRRSLNSELLTILDRAARPGASIDAGLASQDPDAIRRTLGHMLEALLRLQRVTQGRSRETMKEGGVAHLAMLHLIQRAGEAASRLPADFRLAHPEVSWHDLIALRNRIVFGDTDLDGDVAWHAAGEQVGAAIAACERVLSAR